MRKITDRRISKRYRVHLPLHYRVAWRGSMDIVGTGTTRDLSSSGLSFRCRRTLPAGAHVEVTIDWPARKAEVQPIELVITGQVLRSDGGRVAVRMSSRRFRINPLRDEPYLATA